MKKRISFCAPFIVFAFTLCAQTQAQRTGTLLDKAAISQVDTAVQSIMQRNQVPAISLAIVKNGHLVYSSARGYAELPGDRETPGGARQSRLATTATRFAIGSVSKEFTAAAILILVDRGKLSLDDPVSKYLPELTDASQVTIRQLLSHTSGYRDYFLQEYIPLRTQRPTTVETILKEWAEAPLDFAPGTQWQYSSTNYVIAGRIIEKITGEPYERFLTENVLRPASITDATFADHPRQPARNAVGFYRFALGPPRPAPLTGRNWLFAMADLEMTANDVAKWDISLMNHHLLTSSAYQATTADTKTKEGASTGYGLGFFVGAIEGTDGKQHRLLHHPGEISGFRSNNFLLPDSSSAVVILTNAEYSEATSELAQQIQSVVGVKSSANASTPSKLAESVVAATKENAVEARAHRLLVELSKGIVNRGDFAPDAREILTKQAVEDIRLSLAPLGDPQRVTLNFMKMRGGMKHFALTVFYRERRLQIAEYDLDDGRIEQFMIDDL